MNEKDVVHIDSGIQLSHKEERNNAICSNIDYHYSNIGYHTKWSKSERESQIPYAITYTWNLNYDTK